MKACRLSTFNRHGDGETNFPVCGLSLNCPQTANAFDYKCRGRQKVYGPRDLRKRRISEEFMTADAPIRHKLPRNSMFAQVPRSANFDVYCTVKPCVTIYATRVY